MCRSWLKGIACMLQHLILLITNYLKDVYFRKYIKEIVFINVSYTKYRKQIKTWFDQVTLKTDIFTNLIVILLKSCMINVYCDWAEHAKLLASTPVVPLWCYSSLTVWLMTISFSTVTAAILCMVSAKKHSDTNTVLRNNIAHKCHKYNVQMYAGCNLRFFLPYT